MLYQLMMSISSADIRLQEHYGRTMSSLVCHMSSLSHYLQLGDECVARHRWQNTNVPELFELLCHLPLFISQGLTPDNSSMCCWPRLCPSLVYPILITYVHKIKNYCHLQFIDHAVMLQIVHILFIPIQQEPVIHLQ